METLVEGNLCFDNGGKGIQVYLAKKVTVRNNTCYWNTKRDDEGTWRGEIAFSNVKDIRVINNIGVCNTAMGFANSSYNSGLFIGQYGGHNSTGIIWENNLCFNSADVEDDAYRTDIGSAGIQLSDNLFGYDPLFLNDTIDSLSADFRLAEESPAIDAGTLQFGYAETDLDGSPRLMRTNIDIGCYEAVGTILSIGQTGLPASAETLFLYPNPAITSVYIKLDGIVSARQIKIIDLKGKLLLEKSHLFSDRIDVTAFPDGLYLVQVFLDNGTYITRKLMVYKNLG
jgi:hypothetical protein